MPGDVLKIGRDVVVETVEAGKVSAGHDQRDPSCGDPLVDVLLELRVEDGLGRQDQTAEPFRRDQVIDAVLDLGAGEVFFKIIEVGEDGGVRAHLVRFSQHTREELTLLDRRGTRRDDADQWPLIHAAHLLLSFLFLGASC